MDATLDDVRFAVADQPRVFPPPSSDPELIGQGDGVGTIFYTTYPNVVPGSLVVFQGVYSVSGTEITQTFQAVQPSLYTQNGQQITFATPPASGSIPTSGSAPSGGLFARYMATAFSDQDLQKMLARNVATYGFLGTGTVLKGCLYDLLMVIVADVDRLKLIRTGDYQSDAKHLVQQIAALRAELKNDLEGGPRPGAQIPYISQKAGTARSFQTRR